MARVNSKSVSSVGAVPLLMLSRLGALGGFEVIRNEKHTVDGVDYHYRIVGRIGDFCFEAVDPLYADADRFVPVCYSGTQENGLFLSSLLELTEGVGLAPIPSDTTAATSAVFYAPRVSSFAAGSLSLFTHSSWKGVTDSNWAKFAGYLPHGGYQDGVEEALTAYAGINNADTYNMMVPSTTMAAGATGRLYTERYAPPAPIPPEGEEQEPAPTPFVRGYDAGIAAGVVTPHNYIMTGDVISSFPAGLSHSAFFDNAAVSQVLAKDGRGLVTGDDLKLLFVMAGADQTFGSLMNPLLATAAVIRVGDSVNEEGVLQNVGSWYPLGIYQNLRSTRKGLFWSNTGATSNNHKGLMFISSVDPTKVQRSIPGGISIIIHRTHPLTFTVGGGSSGFNRGVVKLQGNSQEIPVNLSTFSFPANWEVTLGASTTSYFFAHTPTVLYGAVEDIFVSKSAAHVGAKDFMIYLTHFPGFLIVDSWKEGE